MFVFLVNIFGKKKNGVKEWIISFIIYIPASLIENNAGLIILILICIGIISGLFFVCFIDMFVLKTFWFSWYVSMPDNANTIQYPSFSDF